jgi:rRNA-processing protein FCF1
MTTTQFPVDVVGELVNILPSYHLYVPSYVMEELENIKSRSKGKARIAASVAIKIAHQEPFTIKELVRKKRESVDDALIRHAKILCTNDRELKQKAREKEIAVVYLRQKKYLAIDGHLKTE